MQLKADTEPIFDFEPEKKLGQAFQKQARASPGFCLILFEPKF